MDHQPPTLHRTTKLLIVNTLINKGWVVHNLFGCLWDLVYKVLSKFVV